VPNPNPNPNPNPTPTPAKTPKTTIVFDYQPNKKVRSITGKRIPLSNKAVISLEEKANWLH